MARRKLNPFTADEASDSFTPSVKTIKGGDVKASEESSKTAQKTKSTKAESKPAPKSSRKSETHREAVEKPAKQTASKSPETSQSKAKPSVNSQPVSDKPKPKKEPKPPVSKQPSAPAKEKKFKKQEPAKAKVKAKEAAEAEQEIIFELVGFMLGEEEFGININNVHEINRMVDITPVPRAPHFVMGVINLRGKVVPVISLRKRLNTEEKEADNKTRIVVVEVKGTIVGFIVDEVTEVLRIPAKSVEPAPDLVAGVQAEYITGVAKLNARLMIMLDLEKVLSKDQIEQLKESSS